MGVPAVPIAIQHHRAGGGPRFLIPRPAHKFHNNVVRGAGACRSVVATSLRRRHGVSMGPGHLGRGCDLG